MKNQKHHLDNDTEPKKVLIFDSLGELMAICRSVSAAGDITTMTPQAISSSCRGRTMATAGLYFRHLDDSLIVESTDLGKLRVKDYDKAVGIIRPYKSTGSMRRDRKRFYELRTGKNKIIKK